MPALLISLSKGTGINQVYCAVDKVLGIRRRVSESAADGHGCHFAASCRKQKNPEGGLPSGS